MKIFISTVFILLAVRAVSQTRHQLFLDSLSIAVSNYIDSNAEHIDSAKLVQFIVNGANELQGSKDSMTIEEKKSLPTDLLIRLLHHSSVMVKKMYAKLPKHTYYTHVLTMPPSSITREECASFWQYHKFTYFNSDSTPTRLSLDENYWIDSMPDDTYAKLRVNKLNDQTFNICFIESNNDLKGKISMPGDIYCYQLLEKKEHAFKLSMHINGIDSYDIFELHY